MQYPNALAIQAIVEGGVEIPTSEFLTYYLFHKKRSGKKGWKTYREISAKTGIAAVELNEWVDFNGDSISTPRDVKYQVGPITERIGESVGMCVINALHGLTAADWNHVPEQPGVGGVKTPDYELAADEKFIIQLEAKGSSVRNNSLKPPSVSNHKSNIAKKKREIAKLEKANNYKYPADLRYGTIAVMGEDPGSPVKCLLVDPPADGDGLRARNLRLIHRMRFLRDWITFLSPRSQLASALQTRLLTIESASDPYSQNGLTLLKGDGESFDFSPLSAGGHSSFFSNKPRITGVAAGGLCSRMNPSNLFFTGIREDLLKVAADQNFNELTQVRYAAGSIQSTVECVFSEGRYRSLGRPRGFSVRRNSSGTLYHRDLTGVIHYSTSGIAFGVLPLA